jgi:hypothetical protein
MQITCTTTEAASQVLLILMNAELRPIRDFTIYPILSTTPPITFTMVTSLIGALLDQVSAITDTMVT